MPRIPERWDGPNEWYFVSIVTRDREPIFSDKNTCISLKKAFREAHKYYPFRLGVGDSGQSLALALARFDPSCFECGY